MTRLALPALLVVLAATGCKKHIDPVAVPAVPIVEAPPAPEPTYMDDMEENFARVHFALDSSELNDGAKEVLAENAAIMLEHPRVKVEIQGHADERGSDEYNLELGDERAATVTNYLVMMGVHPSRLTTVSYGEGDPLLNAENKAAWSKNRRAEFRVTEDPADRVDGTLDNTVSQTTVKPSQTLE